jgi:hypothetical protein
VAGLDVHDFALAKSPFRIVIQVDFKHRLVGRQPAKVADLRDHDGLVEPGILDAFDVDAVFLEARSSFDFFMQSSTHDKPFRCLIGLGPAEKQRLFGRRPISPSD